MATTSHLRGHPITWSNKAQRWLYSDTLEPTDSTWKGRPCGECGLYDTPEGHDGCLGTLTGVVNACCGHGNEAEAYVQYPSGEVVRGTAAVAEIDRLRGREVG